MLSFMHLPLLFEFHRQGRILPEQADEPRRIPEVTTRYLHGLFFGHTIFDQSLGRLDVLFKTTGIPLKRHAERKQCE